MVCKLYHYIFSGLLQESVEGFQVLNGFTFTDPVCALLAFHANSHRLRKANIVGFSVRIFLLPLLAIMITSSLILG